MLDTTDTRGTIAAGQYCRAIIMYYERMCNSITDRINENYYVRTRSVFSAQQSL